MVTCHWEHLSTRSWSTRRLVRDQACCRTNIPVVSSTHISQGCQYQKQTRSTRTTRPTIASMAFKWPAPRRRRISSVRLWCGDVGGDRMAMHDCHFACFRAFNASCFLREFVQRHREGTPRCSFIWEFGTLLTCLGDRYVIVVCANFSIFSSSNSKAGAT